MKEFKLQPTPCSPTPVGPCLHGYGYSSSHVQTLPIPISPLGYPLDLRVHKLTVQSALRKMDLGKKFAQTLNLDFGQWIKESEALGTWKIVQRGGAWLGQTSPFGSHGLLPQQDESDQKNTRMELFKNTWSSAGSLVAWF